MYLLHLPALQKAVGKRKKSLKKKKIHLTNEYTPWAIPFYLIIIDKFINIF